MPQIKAPTLTLNDGRRIPVLGLGTWKSNSGEVTQAVKDAIDAGYRHIDCAHNYGNEREVGAGIRAKIREGVVKREDLFITSKLWNTFHRPDLVETGLRTSLEDLGLDYVDLYLIHWPTAWQEGGERYPRDEDGKVIYSDVDLVDTWRAMEEMAKQGLARSIGVSNFNHRQLERIIESADIKPVINQVECHPYLNQGKLIKFCQSENVVVTCYSPLGSPARLWAQPGDPKPLDDPVLHKIGKKYNKSPAQVILRWQIQRGVIVLPKSVTKSRIIENFNVFDFKLSNQEVDAIYAINKNWRAVPFEQFKDHKEYPFNIEY